MQDAATPWVLMSNERPQIELDVGSVGGKAASLLRLLAMQFAVPEFFVLTSQAYRRNAGGSLCENDRTRIAGAFHALGGDAHEYAVRSSGVAEDSVEFSYAGVFDTILEVRG